MSDSNSSSDGSDVEEGSNEELFSFGQQVVLTVLPMFASAVSLICSILILRVIWFKRAERLAKVFHRYIFIMSILDVIYSTNSLFSSFMVPKGTPDVFGAFGNTKTCNASGFLWQFGFTIPIYNACLSLYFLLRVRYQVKDKFYAKWIEPLVHGGCLIYIGVSAILGLGWTVFNPSEQATGWCIPSEYPWGCNSDPTMACDRGEKYALFAFILISPVVILVMVSLIFNMVCLYCTVRSQEKRAGRYGTEREMRLSKKVGQKAIRFIGAFTFTFIWPSVVPSTLSSVHGPLRFVLLLLLKIFLPLQGLWNFLIYIGPNKQDFKDAYASSHLSRRDRR